MKKLITHEEYEDRLAASKEAIATDTYLLQLNLSDYIVYLENKVRELKELNECLVVKNDTLLKNCVSEKIFLTIKMNAPFFKEKGISQIEKITLEDISKITLFDLWRLKDITGHQIHTIRQILQKLNLKFSK